MLSQIFLLISISSHSASSRPTLKGAEINIQLLPSFNKSVIHSSFLPLGPTYIPTYVHAYIHALPISEFILYVIIFRDSFNKSEEFFVILLSEEINLRVVCDFDPKQMNYREKRELDRILESHRLAYEREETEMRKHYDIIYIRDGYDSYAAALTIKRGDQLKRIPTPNIRLL